MDPLATVPAAKQAAVRSALTAIFGEEPVVATAIAGGASGAQIFRIERDGERALLRVEGDPSPLRFPGQYVSWRAASEAGIAPPLHYLNAANGITMSAYIAQKPLREFPGGPVALAEAVGTLLRRLQALPCFETFFDYPEIVSRLFAHVMRTGLFGDGLLQPCAEQLDAIRARTPWGMQVAAHNDPNPRNILYDGERLWLIDWESAYRNDPLVDIAIALDNFAAAPIAEERLLSAAGVTEPAMLARLHDIRALTRLYYAGVLFSAAATMPRANAETDLDAPTPVQFHAAVRDGRLKAGRRETLLALGKLYLSGFRDGGAVVPLDAV
ncbi:MAG: phosphotransferase [Proteobacteria bacterium]|nr:phosphotransferase [Pseudomonadota bacterium]